MPSVVGLLEQHELAALRRVDGLRAEADRIQAELEWQEWAIARRRVDAVLAPVGGTAETEVPEDPRDTEARSVSGEAAKPKSQVPVWRDGLSSAALSVDYQRILQALADRARLGQGPLTCQEWPRSSAWTRCRPKVEALRSKAKRLVARGWLAERQPGRFTLAAGVAGPGGGS